MIELPLALVDTKVSDRVRQTIKRLPAAAFEDSRQRKLFKSLLDNSDIFGAIEKAEYTTEEIFEAMSSDIYKIFSASSEDVQIARIRTILDEHNKKVISGLTSTFETEILSGIGDISKSLTKLVSGVTKLPSLKEDKGIEEGTKTIMDNALNFLKNGIMPKLSSTYAKFDTLLRGGFKFGDIVTIAGATGFGKTLIIQNWVRKWAKMGKKILYVPIEMPKHQLAERWALMEAHEKNIEVSNTMFSEPTEAEIPVLAELLKIVDGYGIHFCTLQDKISDIEFAMMQDDYDVIVVDHVHLIDGNEDAAKLRAILQVFKRYVENRKTVVILLAQLRKEGAFGTSKVTSPTLDLINGYALLNNISSYVLMLWEDSENSQLKRLHVLKDRHTGLVGRTVDLAWIRERCILEERG